MNIGLKIKELASKKKISILQLSEKLGKSRQTTYDMLEKAHVSSEILVKLCELFDLPITFFFTDTPDDAPLPTSAGKESISRVGKVNEGRKVRTYRKRLANTEQLLEKERKEREKVEHEKERLYGIVEAQAQMLKSSDS